MKEKRLNLRRTAALLTTICMAFALCACDALNRSEPISDTGFYFDTVITVTLYDASRQDALDGCFALADRYEKLFSAQKKESDVSRINASPKKAVKVDPETAELISAGLRYGKESDGAFDITVGKVAALWHFSDNEEKEIPDAKLLVKAASHVDYRSVSVDGDTVTLKDPEAAIDLGGIAKGYIADRMKEYLLKEGVSAGLINLGGNVLAFGEKPDGSEYRVGIQRPFSEDGDPILSVDVRDRSVVTSGNYQRYFEKDGMLFHHILETKTGMPVRNGLNSVTVIGERSVDGDALSTTCFALGREKGMELIENTPDTEAVFVTEDNQLLFSSGMGKDISYKEYP